MKILIAPDKFKGSLTSFQACQAIKKGVQEANPDVEAILLPFADGGDGFAGVMKHYLSTRTIICSAVDPLLRPIQTSYELDESSGTAIIELASASGLVLLKNEERDALHTSTLGCGLMIENAIQKGVKKIILGLGGSATTDAGTGILSALGFQFLDKNKTPVGPGGGNLRYIESIIPPAQLPGIEFEIACDVQNPLHGPRGAAYVYAPQKGASPADLPVLDDGLRHFASIIEKHQHKDVSGIPGTGAAGGIAAGLMAFFNCQLISGVNLVIEASGFRKHLGNADYLLTGEGKLDGQTTEGKVVSELALLATSLDIPAIAFCGIADLEPSSQNTLPLQSIQVITPKEMPLADAMANAASLLSEKARTWLQNSNNTTP